MDGYESGVDPDVMRAGGRLAAKLWRNRPEKPLEAIRAAVEGESDGSDWDGRVVVYDYVLVAVSNIVCQSAISQEAVSALLASLDLDDVTLEEGALAMESAMLAAGLCVRERGCT